MSTMNRGLLDRVWTSVTESQIWRSIFRHGYPDTPLNQSLVMMGNVFLHLHPVKVSRKAMKITYTWCLGGLSFFLFLVLTITGVFLMFYFVPERTLAYANIQQIQQRYHLWRTGAQHAPLGRPPDGGDGDAAHGARLLSRRLQAAARVQLGHWRVLFLTTLLLSFTGYLLPWDQIGYWAITVGSNMASYAPLLGAAGAQRADRPAGGRGPADTHSFLYPARDWPAAGRRGVDGRPLLAHP